MQMVRPRALPSAFCQLLEMQMEAANAADVARARGSRYALPSAFCQLLEMQMEAANAADVARAFRVCAFRSVPVPFPFRSSFCVRAGVPCVVTDPTTSIKLCLGLKVIPQLVTSEINNPADHESPPHPLLC